MSKAAFGVFLGEIGKVSRRESGVPQPCRLCGLLALMRVMRVAMEVDDTETMDDIDPLELMAGVAAGATPSLEQAEKITVARWPQSAGWKVANARRAWRACT